MSGRGERALRGQAARLNEHVAGDPELCPADVGLSLAGRATFAHRGVVVGGDRERLLAGLQALAHGETAVGVVEGVARGGSGSAGRGGGGRTVFVFPGQGGQWQGMAAEMTESSEVFARSVQECEEALAPHVEWSLASVLAGEGEAASLERVDVVQPALFAMMVSLARVWEACGVRPDAVVGHSQGEIAAALLAGGLSLQDAARLVALRSKLLSELVGAGWMASVALGGEELAERLQRWGERIVIAALNGPAASVVSGERAAIEELLAECEAEGVRARGVAGALGAGHSPQVEALRERMLAAFAPVVPRASEVPFYSTLTGGPLSTAELGAEHWYRNARETVRFAQAVRGLLAEGPCTLIEVSPHPVLTGAVQGTVEDVAGDAALETGVVGTLRRGQGGAERLLTSLAEAWVRGVNVEWGAVFQGSAARRVGLPTYAFQRRHYWVSASAPGAGASASGAGGLTAAEAGRAPAQTPQAGAQTPQAQAADAGDGELAAADTPADGTAGAAGSLARRVAVASEDERAQIVTEAVRTQIAVVLGHESAEEIDPRQPLLELGFDSVTALELRNRMRVATGLELPATLLFEHPTPAALAAGLLHGLAHPEDAGTRSGGAHSGGAESASGTLVALMREAGGRGEIGEFMELLSAASRFRPTFEAHSDPPQEAPGSLRLATGAGRPSLVCLPTVLATAGPHQYAKFAHGFRDERDVAVLTLPGFAEGERLPASVRDVAAVHAEAVGRLALDAPPVLVGYSAGGVLAYALAGYLQSIGCPPAGVVLIDTLSLAHDAVAEVLGNVVWGMLAREDVRVPVSDAGLTAMAAYGGLLAGWEPVEVAAPTLALRANALTSEVFAELAWATAWGVAHETVEVPGNHVALMEENVDSTAQAVKDWLATTTDVHGR